MYFVQWEAMIFIIEIMAYTFKLYIQFPGAGKSLLIVWKQSMAEVSYYSIWQGNIIELQSLKKLIESRYDYIHLT